MSVSPAKLLKGTMANNGFTGSVAGTVSDIDSMWYGLPTEWNVRLTIEPQNIAVLQPDGNLSYTATSIKVGDWVASSVGGIAVKITQIVEVIDPGTIDLVVVDDDFYNIHSDPSLSGASIGPDGPCVVFEVDERSGIPVLSPMPPLYLDATFQGDVLARFIHQQKLKLGSGGGGGGTGDGSSTLTEPSDGTYSDGYVKGWEVGTTLVSDAFQALNRALLELGPAKPKGLNQQFLDIEGGVSLLNTDPVVLAADAFNASGVADADLPAPGTVIKRVRVDSINTTEIGPFGPGNSGQIELEFNGTKAGVATLDVGDNSGIYDSLEITTDTEYPLDQPGAFEAITVRGVGLSPAPGINMVQFKHDVGTETRKVFFVYDTTVTRPSVDSANVSESEDPLPLVLSSGIPHYTRGTRLRVSGTVNDLATDIALGRRNVLITTKPVAVGPTTWLSNGSFGLHDVFTKGKPESFLNAEYAIDDTDESPAYGTVQLSVTGRNANGSSEFTIPTWINVMRGGVPTELSYLEELNVPVYNLGTPVEGKPLFARRLVGVSTENTPADDAVFADWNSTLATALHEASVVGGRAIMDKTDYSKDYLPLGPDYSGKADQQYITFAINRRAVSQMIIQIRGSYTRLFIKLPGIAAQPLSVNGWMDAMKLYDGAGVPGRDSEDGCAVGKAGFGFDQDLRVTFGSESSTNSRDNLILIRFLLTEGNAIQALRFTGVN